MYFKKLAEYFKKIEDTQSRIAMTKILAELFCEAKNDEVGKICYLLQGRVAPLYEPLEFGIADKLMIKAISIATGLNQSQIQEEFKKIGDLGFVMENCYSISKYNNNTNNNVSILDVFSSLYELTKIGGQGSQDKKIIKLAELLTSVDSLSARYLVRIPLDKLRLGFSEMTILDALSWMIKKDKSLKLEFENAYNVRPDIGFIAESVKNNGTGSLSHISAKVGVPILPALCQRLPTADEMIEKMGQVAVEPKYDGMRVQIHYNKNITQSFSRNLEYTTQMFPELNDIDCQISAESVILDSEVVVVDGKSGKIMPFQETTTRKRKHDIGLFTESSPVRFFVFDILLKNGKDLLSESLKTRRKILEETVKAGQILHISPQIIVTESQKIRKYHDTQIDHGLEGVVVKKWDSPYEPGRRGFSWVKFKEEEGTTGKLSDTIDCVIMGYYQGEGKRSGFGIGAFLVGVKSKESFVTVTKIGTGVSDNLWKDIKNRLEIIKEKNKPAEYPDINKSLVPDVWVRPEMVVEIAADDITKSPIHGAGYALRFPRLVKIRSDKNPQEATTVLEITDFYNNQLSVKKKH